MPRINLQWNAGLHPLSLLVLIVVISGLIGCSDSTADAPDAQTSTVPQVAAPQVTQPFDVRDGDAAPPAQGDSATFQLATATEPIVSAPPAPTHDGRPVIEAFKDWSLSETAARALGRMGSAAVPELAGALSDPNPQMRRRAADILAEIGPDAKDAVPALTRALDDRDEDVRKAAARALGEIGPDAKEAVPYLIEALREPGKIPEGE